MTTSITFHVYREFDIRVEFHDDADPDAPPRRSAIRRPERGRYDLGEFRGPNRDDVILQAEKQLTVFWPSN